MAKKQKHNHYAYTTMDLLKMALFMHGETYIKTKCGDTTRKVQQRVGEQSTGNASNTILAFKTPAKVDGRDYEFHTFLENKKNYTKVKEKVLSTISREVQDWELDDTGSEWFNIPLKDIGIKNLSKQVPNMSEEEKQYHFLEAVDSLIAYMNKLYSEHFCEDQNNNTFPAGLMRVQQRLIENSLRAVANGICNILWHVCARGQKTKMSLLTALALDVDIVVVCSYVLSVFASYISDTKSFSQTCDRFAIVNCNDSDYKKQIATARRASKKVILLMSLCGGEKFYDEDGKIIPKSSLKDYDIDETQTADQRKDRLAFIRKMRCTKMWIVEEADQGAWCLGQYKVVAQGRKDDEPLFVETGTNPERAMSQWDIEYVDSIMYSEMVEEKRSLM